MKIASIIGARPQFIKLKSIIKNLKKNNIKNLIIHTGQHFDKNMNDIFFSDLRIPKPKYNLKVHSLNRVQMISRISLKLEKILKFEKPDYVILFGDTNSTLAGALTSHFLGIKIIHIEAGLRSLDKSMPEETNRIITDQLSDILFCPTEIAVKNLKKEGFPNKKIFKVGDIMFDLFLEFSKFSKKPSFQIDKNFILLTIHREKNTNFLELKKILKRINSIKGYDIIFPVHPRIKSKIIKKINLNKRIKIIEPQSYINILWLLQNCKLVITDSGGLQKESYFAKKPCLVLRKNTEWMELLKNGSSALFDASKRNINYKLSKLLNKKHNFNKKFYGNGLSSSKIIKIIKKNYKCQ